MRRTIFTILICIGLIRSGVSAVPRTGAQGNGTAIITPNEISGTLCGSQCLTQAVQIQLPPLASAPLKQLDVMLVMDNSSSMTDVIQTVKDHAITITENLRGLVSDTRFAAAVFADYDVGEPWQLLTDFTADPTAFNQVIDSIQMQEGGSTWPESYTRALWESEQLSWRDSAVHILVLFTDDEPHYDDPGRDGQEGTGDDLSYNATLAALQARNIRVISVNSGGNSDAEQALQQAANATGGRYYALEAVQNMPQELVALIKQELDEFRLSFVSVREDQRGWVTQTPEAFDYPPEGGTVTVTLSFCPGAAGLPTNTYTVPLNLQTASQVYGTMQVQVHYTSQCVNLLIPDNEADTGDRCSDINNTVFWESPAIIVRQAADNGRAFQYPLPRHENYIYIETRNVGQQDARDGELVIYASPTLMVSDFPADWHEIGRQPVSVPVGRSVWTGPFPWIPENEGVSLRVVVQSPLDPVTKPNDFACDSNIAQVNRAPLTLYNYSLEPGKVSDDLPVVLRSPVDMGYESLDLIVDTSKLPATGYVVFQGSQSFLTTWQANGGLLQGGQLRSAQAVVFPAQPNAGVLSGFIRGLGTTVEGVLITASGSPSDSGDLRLGLRAKDRVVTGATLNLQPLPQPEASESGRSDTGELLPVIIPILLFLGLIGLSLLLFFSKRPG